MIWSISYANKLDFHIIFNQIESTYVLQWQQYYFFLIAQYLFQIIRTVYNWLKVIKRAYLSWKWIQTSSSVKLKKVTCLNNILCQYRLWMNYFALCVYTVTFTFKSFSFIFSWHIDHMTHKIWFIYTINYMLHIICDIWNIVFVTKTWRKLSYSLLFRSHFQ